MAATFSPAPAQSFWADIPSAIHSQFTLAIPTDRLSAFTALYSPSSPLRSKLEDLRGLAAGEVTRRYRAQEDCSAALKAHNMAQQQAKENPTEPTKEGEKVREEARAAERDARARLVGNSLDRPDLGALSSLPWALYRQGKLEEAEALLRATGPLMQSKIGRDSPQALGCWRLLVSVVNGLGRKEEAKGLLEETRRLAEGLRDESLRESEVEAVEEVRREIEG